MRLLHGFVMLAVVVLCVGCKHSQSQSNFQPVDLQQQVTGPFEFAVYGDTRFTDSSETTAANPVARRALVKGIADAHPAFVSIVGDISYNGNDPKDWKVFDAETSIWRDKNIFIYPAIGNHELHGNLATALGNYFERFPMLKNSRYYSVHIQNALVLVLDSALDENSGPQAKWLQQKLNNVPSDVDFVFLFLHHPPYTSSSDARKFGGGHSARSDEQTLAQMLESRQKTMRARIVVFSGHVHNFERHEHGGITYFVCGGGGAHAYPIERAPSDPYQSKEVNYHFLLAEVDHQTLRVTMNRLDLSTGTPVWTQPDSVTIDASRAVMSNASSAR